MSSPVEFSIHQPERKPPFNDDAEEAVLSAMFMDERALTTATTIVDDTTFYRERNRRIFRAILDVFQEGSSVDPLTVAAKLESRGELRSSGGKDYIAHLLDVVPTAANVEYHAKIVREHAQLRRLIEIGQRMSSDAFERAASSTEIAQGVSASLLPVAASTKSGGFVAVKDLLWPVMEDIEARVRGTAQAGIPFGYRAIDSQTGGVKPGELVFICGVPASGKTALLLNIGIRAALVSNHGTAIVSAEMGAKSLVERLLNGEGRIESLRTRRGTLHDDDFARLGRAAGLVSHAPIWIDDTATPKLADIRAKCRALKADHPDLKLILLDFIQLIGGDDDENRSLELTQISYALKGLAKELEVAVIATCQVDAASVEKSSDKRPRLSMLRWSQGMREAADMIALVFRAGQYDSDALPLIELDFKKVRDLAEFRVNLSWIGKYMLVEDL
jgi:replicative DNA helicase